MLIVNDSIVDDQHLGNAEKEFIRSASYYLRIDSIIPAGEDARKYDIKKPKRDHVLKPGALAWVVSKEVFSLADFSVTALVTLRSSFTKKGLLALDVGLVDAHFEGPIGSVVINFSKNDIHLHEGQEFFRVVFLKHEEIDPAYRLKEIKFTHDEYARERLSDLVEGFPATFLQADEIEKRIKTSVMQKEVIDKLEKELIDKLESRLKEKYFWKVLLGGLAGIAILALVVWGIISGFVPEYSAEEIQDLIKKYIESQAGGSDG